MSDGAIGGKYVPVRPLASGGMAEVELAKQVGIDGFEKLVVLKRIRPEYATNADFVTRFLDEARTVADLRHPNLVQVYEAGRDDSGFFLAMSFVHGISVRQLQRALEAWGERITTEHALHIAIGAARGLAYAHEKRDLEGRPLGIVHRDVSPQNILLSFEGEVKLADFGIARAEGQRHATRPGHIWGKLDYMPPEQARGGSVSAASDQFALGVVLWELLTGERLFRRESDVATVRAVLECAVPAPSSRVPGLAPSMEAVLLKALDPDPRNRHPSCAAFAEELESYAARAGMVLSDARLGAYLRQRFPAESTEPSATPTPVRVAPARAPSATLSEPPAVALGGAHGRAGASSGAPEPASSGKGPAPARAASRRAAHIAGLAFAVLAALGAWTAHRYLSGRRALERADAALRSGDPALAAALAAQVLSRSPGDARAREVAARAIASESERRAQSDPSGARAWLAAKVSEMPALEDLLRTRLHVLEARDVARGPCLQTSLAVADVVRRYPHEPEVALAAAGALRQSCPPETYVWMYDLALKAGASPQPYMFDDAVESMRRNPPRLGDPAAGVAASADRTRLSLWVRKAWYSARGFELLSALDAGKDQLKDHPPEPYLDALRSLVEGGSDFAVAVLVEALPELAPDERRRILDTLRVAKDDPGLTTNVVRGIDQVLASAKD